MSEASSTTSTTASESLHLRVPPAFQPLYEEAYSDRYRHFFLWGGRGAAKSRAMSDFLAIHGRYDRGTFLCTREIQNSLAESVFTDIRESIERIGIPGYYLTENTINHQLGAHFHFAGIGYRDGQHVKSTTNIRRAWTEEAHQVSGKSLEILIPTVRAPGSKLYYTFNRTLHRDAVYGYFLSFKTRGEKLWVTDADGNRHEWRMYRGDGAIGIFANYDSNPFFPDVLEEDRRRDERNAEESGDWSHYNHVWRGMPQASSDSSIITIRQAIEASRREADEDGAIEIGADIARGGKDLVTFYKRKGMRVIGAKEYRRNASGERRRITQTAERLMAFAGDDKTVRIKVDDTGLGGGVTDILEDSGYNVVGVNFAQNANDRDHYGNAASEMWFDFAAVVDEASIPDDVELIEELTERREGRRDSKGRRTVEKKEDFIARVGRSPDKADALLLCFYEPDHVISDFDFSVV